jgi:hypothetical protein
MSEADIVLVKVRDGENDKKSGAPLTYVWRKGSSW